MFCWVEPDLFSLECNKVSSSEFGGVYGFGMALGSLYMEAQGYVPGLCSCVAGEFLWYVLLWNLLALGWCLVSV